MTSVLSIIANLEILVMIQAERKTVWNLMVAIQEFEHLARVSG